MKTLAIALTIAVASIFCGAAPHPGPRPTHRPPIHGYGPRVPPPRHHHLHRPPIHGYGPRVPPPRHHHPMPSFVSGIVGGFLGSAIVEAFRPNPPVVVAAPSPSPTVIVQSPIVVPRQVWIEGKYEDQLVNGILVRKWIPGHWETIWH